MHRLVLGSSIVFFVLAACNGSSNSSTQTQASMSDAAPPPSSDDASAAPGLSNGACMAIIAYDERCADTPEARSSDCANARRADCDRMTRTLSVSFHDAAMACLAPTAECGSTESCLADKLSKAKPTDTMLKVRDDYCATCGAEAGADCANAFFRISGATYGDGILVLQVSDELARDIDANCTGSALDLSGAPSCRDAFGACAQTELGRALPRLPSACIPRSTGGPDAGQARGDGG